jgi:hypothetical protein
VAEELIHFKIRLLNDLIEQIISRWNETDTEIILQNVREGRHPNAENDAIEL